MTYDPIRIGGLEVQFLQSRPETGGAVDIFEMTVHPNARMPVPHYHKSWDEVAYGLEGATTFTVDGKDHIVTKGGSVFIKRGVVHGFRNDTQDVARCLCLLTPGALGPAYFEEIGAVLSEKPPDMGKIKEIMARYRLIPVAPE